MILGTAGHIDHGKTTLVRALTGVDTDRLPEEKRRGITIDLGFAPLDLHGVARIGVVDVPGHEAFVRTMLAGATGIDLAMLVIAADEGIMPQTREHLAILGLLGVEGVVVALTKADLVEADWLELVAEEVALLLGESSLAGARIVPVSSVTGSGLDELRSALASAARAVPERAAADLFRMPVDRAFTVRGTGTVVTGTVWSGELSREEPVRLFPGGAPVRVRGLQAHGRAVDAIHAGERAAVALAGVPLELVGRGALLATGAAWRATRALRAEVALLESSVRGIGPRTRVRLHLGTADVGARVVVTGGALAAGETRGARVVLDEPIVARAGDRFVLRLPSPAVTIGGGVVTDPFASPRARPWPHDRGWTPARLLAMVLADAGPAGVEIAELPVRLGVPPRHASQLVQLATAWRVGDRAIDGALRGALEARVVDAVDRYHAAHPLDAGAPSSWLRAMLRVPDAVLDATVASLAARGTLALGSGVVRAGSFTPTLDPALAKLAGALVAFLDSAGAEPPTLPEVAAQLGVAEDALADVARHLAREGALVAVEPARYFTRSVVTRLTERMCEGMEVGIDYGPADLRGLIGLTRKFLIPFLEYCDREGYTIRDELGRRRRVVHGRSR